MDEWYPFFFGHLADPPTLPHNRTPRVSVNMRYNMSDEAKHGQMSG